MMTLCLWLALSTVPAKPATDAPPAEELVGQFVCSQCWFEADRTHIPYGTPSDLDCAGRCAKADVPPAFAVKNEDGFELLLVESDQNWLDVVGSYARVQGTVESGDEHRVLRVASIEMLDESPWPTVAAQVAPAELIWSDLTGHAQTLEAYRGRIVVLNFWATWCEPCRKEMPDLVRIQNRYGMYGVQVLGAAADPPLASESVIDFAKKMKMNFPVLLGASSPQMQSLGLGTTLPGTVVFDRHGHAAERIPGVFDREVLEDVLEQMLRDEHEDEDGGSASHDSSHAEPAADHDHLEASAAAAHTHAPRVSTEGSLVPS